MARGDFAKPAPLTDEGLYNARVKRVMFVNPPGYDHYADVRPFGRRYDKFDSEHNRQHNYSPNHEQRERRFSTQGERDGFAVHNRPVKSS